MRLTSLLIITAALTSSAPAFAADQTVIGAGNAAADKLASGSPLVTSALVRIEQFITTINNEKLKAATRDALLNADTCVAHRANLTAADKEKIVSELTREGLINEVDGKQFPGGVIAGVFPPLRADGTACPHLPMAWSAAPGSVFNSHHSYPGGLAVHESFNLSSALSFSDNYRLNVGLPGPDGLPRAAPLPPFGSYEAVVHSDVEGGKGDSRTGGHHILGLAEAMARDLPPVFIIVQASAHSMPAQGHEYMVVNWLRAAAIIAGVDPIARGYLVKDGAGRLHLPPVRTKDDIDFLAIKQDNVRIEAAIHNLSDADYVFASPAVTAAVAILVRLAPDYGYDPSDTSRFNNGFRNPVLSYLSAERVLMRYNSNGLEGVRNDLDALRKAKAI
jgi:hypothetical protein